MAYSLAPVIKQQFFDDNGDPLAGGKIYSYQAGTTTPQATYTSSTGGTPNANPVVLDAAGRAAIWLNTDLSYKFLIKTSADASVFNEDNIIGLSTNNSVATASIQDLAVTTAKLADDSVTSAKLQDDASIDANRAVTANHIRDGIISPIKLSSASVAGNSNISITTSVASNALTVSLKAFSGSDASATNPIKIRFRSSSLSDGVPVVRSVTGALSVVVPSTTTLGTTNGVAEFIYLYAIDNAGAVELALSADAFPDEGATLNTTAISGGSSRGTLYSTAARTGVAIRLLGRIQITEATAGTWASNATAISVAPFSQGSRSMVRVYTANGYGSTNTKIRRFTNTATNIGTAITYADSATLGASFTINESGVYSITFSDNGSGVAGSTGISLNSTQLTTSLPSITDADRLAEAAYIATANQSSVSSWTGVLKSGDVIRAHTDATAAGSSNKVNFTICQVSR